MSRDRDPLVASNGIVDSLVMMDKKEVEFACNSLLKQYSFKV